MSSDQELALLWAELEETEMPVYVCENKFNEDVEL